MAERSGFFPYVEGDSNSEYNSAFLARLIHSFIGSGVYNGDLAVAAGENMQIKVPAGQAWINGYFYHNDNDMVFDIDNADGVLNRKDIVVLRWDINARSISLKVLEGAKASDAAAPEITRDAEQYDLKLAEISIPAGTTAITQSLITDTRLDDTVCGIVTGVVKQVDTTKLYNQIADDLARFRTTNEADFTAWVASLHEVLDDETAGNLLDLINSHKADQTVHMTTLACTKTDTVYALTGLTATSGLVSCVFKADADYAVGDTFTVGGIEVTAQQQDGENLPDGYFKTGTAVPCVYDVGNKTLNFKQSGSDMKLNVFAQPDEPTEKNGVWLKTSAKETLKKVVFDTNVWAAGQWQNPSLIASPPSIKLDYAMITVGDYTYFFGGYNQTVFDTAYCYNHTTNTFSSIASMPEALYAQGCATIDSEHIWLFGGMNTIGGDCTPNVYRYNISTNTYTKMNTFRNGAFCVCIPYISANNESRIYIFGGIDGSSILRLSREYNPYNDTYKYMSYLPDEITYFSGVEFENIPYLIGGTNSSGTYVNTIYKYNIEADTFTAVVTNNYVEINKPYQACVAGHSIYMRKDANRHLIEYDVLQNDFTDHGIELDNVQTCNGITFAINKILDFKPEATQCFMLTAKQYSNSPSFIIHYLPTDITHKASIVSSKLLDYLPTYFKDCMLFKDGGISFPALYIGNGTSWNLARSAQ